MVGMGDIDWLRITRTRRCANKQARELSSEQTGLMSAF
jgi:hypothetical protein